MKLINIVGARPNFMKMAPIVRQLERHPEIEWQLIHTGQHYDDAMSRVFFEELQLPPPHVFLGVGSGSQAEQTAQMMVKLEQVMQSYSPDMVLVVGDTNSALAGALTAAKLCIPVAHVEAGLRSYDRTMPEEINRQLRPHHAGRNQPPLHRLHFHLVLHPLAGRGRHPERRRHSRR